MINADDELELRLRRDARTWDASPSPAIRQRLHAAIRAPVPPGTRRRSLAAAAAAAALLIVAIAAVLHRPLPPAKATHRAMHLDAALAPLQRELAAVTDDAHAVVDALWQGVRRPLLCITGR